MMGVVVQKSSSPHPAVLQKVILRHQSAIRSERLVADTEAKLPTSRKEFEIQRSLTQWVNPLGIGFRFQTLTRSALALLGINFNGG